MSWVKLWRTQGSSLAVRAVITPFTKYSASARLWLEEPISRGSGNMA